MKRSHLLLIVWIVCGLYNYGSTLAFESRLSPEIDTGKEYRLVLAAAGPMATPVVVYGTHFNKYGWRLW